jgi:PKD repeat protein
VLGLVVLAASLTSVQPLSKSLSISSIGKIKYFPGTIGSNVWKADFETGNLSQFSGIEVDSGNLLEVTSTVRHHGSYSMRLRKKEGIPRAMGYYEPPSAMRDFHFSFALMIGEDFTTSNWLRLFELRPTTRTPIVVFMDLYPSQDSRTCRIYFVEGRTDPLTLNKGQWYTFNIFVSSAKNGMVFLFMDGSPLAWHPGGLDWTDHNGNPYELWLVMIGCVGSSDGVGNGTLYYDDIRLDEWIPPERQPQSPSPFFIYYPTTPEPGEEVIFFAYHSFDIDGNITRYLWDFGDGSSGEGMNITHTFTSEGLYTVTLNVTDDSGLSSTFTSIISVEVRQSVPVVGGWVFPLRIEGKKILDANGNDVTLNLTGVGKMGFEYADGITKIPRECDPTYFGHDLDLMKSWGIKVVRLAFNLRYYMTNYRYRNDIIKSFIDLATSRGMLIIMDVHWYSMGKWTSYPIGHTLTKNEAWKIWNDTVLCLKSVAHDFQYNPMVIAVEVNEYRPFFPDDTEDYFFKFYFERTASLAAAVGQVNPDMLVGIEIPVPKSLRYHTLEEIVPLTKPLIDPYPIVLMNHIYCSSSYGWTAIWELYGTDPEQGKIEWYNVLDTQFLSLAESYGLPSIVTEWGSDFEQGPQIIRDQFDYFIAHNWGSAYWAWFRAGPVGDAWKMGLLCDDWETPSFAGEAYLQKLVTIE